MEGANGFVNASSPRSIRVDNGPEFAGRLLDQGAYLNKVELVFSRPGKPADNAYIEAFNSQLRQECLNAACPWQTPSNASTNGGSTIMKTGRIHRSET